MLNRVTLIGVVGRDPELRRTQGDVPICVLSVATNETYTDKDGKRVDKTEWHRVKTFQKSAEACSQGLRKGSLVYVEGSLSTRRWQDQQGQDRYSTEVRARRVLFLDRKAQPQRHQQQQIRLEEQQPYSALDEMDDMPF